MVLSTKQIKAIVRDTAKVSASPTKTYGDGDGLYLQVTTVGRSWLLRFTFAGVRRVMGLGDIKSVGLAMARQMAAEQRALVARGIDPVAHRDALQRARKAAVTMTFQEAAERWFQEQRRRMAGERAGWLYTHLMETHAYPQIGKLAITDIGMDDACACCARSGSARTPPARRLMGWVGLTIDATRETRRYRCRSPQSVRMERRIGIG